MLCHAIGLGIPGSFLMCKIMYMVFANMGIIHGGKSGFNANKSECMFGNAGVIIGQVTC